MSAVNDDEDMPEYIIEQAGAVSNCLLQKKSKERYERTYSEFINWKEENNVTSFSKRTLSTLR